MCWGNNSSGQLGDKSTTNSLTPVEVYGMYTGAKAVSASYLHTCAISSKGAAKCWGYNGTGALGDNSTTTTPKPVTVFGLTKGVKQISAGYSSTCAVNGKGKVLCWGFNAHGELGDNSTTNSPKPVGVYGLRSGIKTVNLDLPLLCPHHQGQGHVLGLQRLRRAGRQLDDDLDETGGRLQTGQGHQGDRRRRAHLRGHRQEGRQVLGLQQLRADWRQLDDHHTPAGEGVRLLIRHG